MKKVRLVLVGILLVIVAAVGWCYWGPPIFDYIIDFYNYERNQKPPEFEPLGAEVLQDICPKLEIITGKEECPNGELLYELDLIDTLVKMVKRKGYLSQKEDWDLYFSEYLWFCENPVHPKNGQDYFRCIYDFQDDEVRGVLTIYFYVDGNIMDIRQGGGSS